MRSTYSGSSKAKGPGVLGGIWGGAGNSSSAAIAGTVMKGFTARGCQQQNPKPAIGPQAAADIAKRRHGVLEEHHAET